MPVLPEVYERIMPVLPEVYERIMPVSDIIDQVLTGLMPEMP